MVALTSGNGDYRSHPLKVRSQIDFQSGMQPLLVGQRGHERMQSSHQTASLNTLSKRKHLSSTQHRRLEPLDFFDIVMRVITSAHCEALITRPQARSTQTLPAT